jgi:hypothetical protein
VLFRSTILIPLIQKDKTYLVKMIRSIRDIGSRIHIASGGFW